MREAGLQDLQVHHRQSFKAPGNTAGGMVGACCYINIDPQLARGSFSQGWDNTALSCYQADHSKVRGEPGAGCDNNAMMMKQYRSVGSCHPPRQYESEPSSSVTLDRQQFVLLLSCRRCSSVPRTLDRSRGEADTCVSCVVGHVHHTGRRHTLVVGHVHHHQCVVVVQCEQTLYFLLIPTVH